MKVAAYVAEMVLPRPWTNLEEASLRSWIEDGVLIKTVAGRLHRSTHAVTRRMRDLEITSACNGAAGRRKLNLWLSDEAYDAIAASACKAGVTQSQFVRNVIKRHFDLIAILETFE